MEKNNDFFGGVLIFIAFAAIMISLVSCTPDENTEICLASQEQVKTMLKVPESTTFKDCDKSEITDRNGKKHFFSTLRSKNSFGVMVGNNFACDVSPDDYSKVSCEIY